MENLKTPKKVSSSRAGSWKIIHDSFQAIKLCLGLSLTLKTLKLSVKIFRFSRGEWKVCRVQSMHKILHWVCVGTYYAVLDLGHTITEKQNIYCFNLLFSTAEAMKISIKVMFIRPSQLTYVQNTEFRCNKGIGWNQC